MLKQHGLDPQKAHNPTSAWKVFVAFLDHDITGLETGPESDGFGVAWGRNSWNDHLPSLSFSRYLAVDAAARETDYEPESWRVDLTMVFADAPALADVAALNTQDSGIYYERPGGPEMAEALREVLWEIEQYPALQALWASTPTRSTVALERLG